MVLTLVFVKKGCSLAFLAVIVIVGTILCGATSASSSHKKSINFKSHYSSSCNATIGECRMAVEELELPMDAEISRRLLAMNGGGPATQAIKIRDAVGPNCRGKYSANCLPGKNNIVNTRCQPSQRCRLNPGS